MRIQYCKMVAVLYCSKAHAMSTLHYGTIECIAHLPAHTIRELASLILAEEEVRQEVGDVLVELVLRRQQHGLVVDEQQEGVEEEQEDDAQEQHGVGADAVLLRRDTDLAVQRLEEVAQARADAHTLGQGVAHAVLRQLLAGALDDGLRVGGPRNIHVARGGTRQWADEGGPEEQQSCSDADERDATGHLANARGRHEWAGWMQVGGRA
eukprot:CAMPEP_0183388212 /NCGR_PEP_ID=MMETSP0370-20130417/3880_1 /TAXON_ID=268820 /ORGANISM="Peridinium aciculiferum, Strain PAER-2" /LENGTH=208 /DNA_ID=CAMNT_0025567071 /DNA_START=52 /DNA_END=679 /DNA_ORIENTATION=-